MTHSAPASLAFDSMAIIWFHAQFVHSYMNSTNIYRALIMYRALRHMLGHGVELKNT